MPTRRDVRVSVRLLLLARVPLLGGECSGVLKAWVSGVAMLTAVEDEDYYTDRKAGEVLDAPEESCDEKG